jgi:hypothetical protein
LVSGDVCGSKTMKTGMEPTETADRQRLIEGLEQAVIRYGWALPNYDDDEVSYTHDSPTRWSAFLAENRQNVDRADGAGA